MKLRTILKIATVTSVVLLCLGVAISFYFRMSVTERAEDFDLYTLVPPDTQAVIDTDNVVNLMQHINELNCSKDQHFLYFSRFFSYLKEHINGFLEQTPHGLSKQMSKMLISFHGPDNDRNQVFYCRLGAGDYEFVNQFIHEKLASTFPSRSFDYRGEKIRIYPMPDDDFLACFATTEFLVVSYQKKLVEQVIDAYLTGKSILSDQVFAKMQSEHRAVAQATVYARLKSVDMGKSSDALRSQIDVADWTEFTVNLNTDAIYLSGVNYDTDSCATFIGALQSQAAIEEFAGDLLPASTFFFTKTSISDLNRMVGFTSNYAYTKATYSDAIMEGDQAVFDFLKMYAGSTLTTCMFTQHDTLAVAPHAISVIPIQNAAGAARALSLLYRSVASYERIDSVPETVHFEAPVSHTCYALPRNALFARLTGGADASLFTYACLYKKQLYISPYPESIRAYIEFLESGEARMADVPVYENVVATLSHSYNFMMMTNMGQLLEQSVDYGRFVPNFFFRHSEFFRHFTLTAQFACVDGLVYPNLILYYNSDSI